MEGSFVARCYNCIAPRSAVESLKICSGCKLVNYCSRQCQKDDRRSHKHICKEFPVVKGNNALFTTGPWEEHIAGLREREARLPFKDVIGQHAFLTPRVCNTCRESLSERLTDCNQCASVCYCSAKCTEVDEEHKKFCTDLARKERVFSWHYIMMSYPMSLKYALSVGIFTTPLTTLNIHIVNSTPMLDLVKWEKLLLHHAEQLIHLNLVFVIGFEDRMYNPLVNPSNTLNQPICNNCHAQNRSITYSIQKMPYHKFFSSSEYTEPNFVVIFGNKREMATNADNVINRELSYRNMIHSKQTILILFDETKELVEKGYSAFNGLEPLDTLVEPKLNEYRNFSSMRFVLGYTYQNYNDRNYFTIFRKKW